MKPARRNRALIDQLKQEREKISPVAPSPAIDAAVAPADSVAATPTPSRAQSPSPAPTEIASVACASSADEFAWPPVLAAQLVQGRWTRAGLLTALAADLPPDFPAIYFRNEVICDRGIYRSVKRSRDGTVVRIEHSQGAQEFAPYETSKAVRTWRAHFSRHPSADPQRAAIRMCCADLVKSLTSFEDYRSAAWTKKIDPLAWQLISP